MFPEPFGRPMQRRDEAMRGVHVPPPRPRGPGTRRTSRTVWIGGLIAAGVGVIAVTALLIATGDDVTQGTETGQGTAMATDASSGVPGKSADGGSAVASADKGEPGAATAQGDSKSDAGAAADDDKSAPGEPGDDKTASSDTKAGDDSTDAGAVNDVKTTAADPKADEKAAPADPKADEKTAPADPKTDEKTAPADPKTDEKTAPADPKTDEKTAAADPKPDEKTAPVEDKPVEDKPVEEPSGPAEDSETRRRPVALITLQIDSLPRGAAVIRKKDGVRLGETPFTYETEPQGGSIAIILRHKGYRDEHVLCPAIAAPIAASR